LRLTDLLGTPAAALEIGGLTADSRQVAPGWLFAALAGTTTDGARFVDDALARGAAAVLATPDAALEARVRASGAAFIADANPRQRLAHLAARFHGAQPATIAAVTGTNGKTSVATFTRELWEKLGLSAASLGTLGVHAAGFDLVLAHTTPDPVTLHDALAQLARHGVTHLAMEASSHGLAQHRLDGVAIRAAAFTNLTRDHLDYHATAEDYLAAKMRLFDTLLPAGAPAVLNADSDWYETVAASCTARGQKILSYGYAGREMRIERLLPHAGGVQMKAELFGHAFDIALPLVGGFQASNALCALGLVAACGADLDKAVAALATLSGVPGRMQRVAEGRSGAPIFVDYAHTPDALETVLNALRPHTVGRLSLVFGAGGDRDRGKRPQMGAIAARLADIAYVTDDNPRGEDPASIRAAILAACPGAIEIGDRAAAIGAAIAGLGAGDVLLIAGKGHEQGQTIAGVVRPFDDAHEARAAAEKTRRPA
jgi:UDP-N-acetylmuramoyl-L-alanyl-D-glutamate--2,6-diaminopimelate ligase